MYYSNLKKVVEWLQTEILETILSEVYPAHSSIECSECGTSKEVKVIDWGISGMLFWCENCILKIRKDGLPQKAVSGLLRLRFQVFERDRFKCVYCGRNPREDDTKLEIEHVHPKSKGGLDSLDNLVTSCRECNAGKGDYLLDQRQKDKIINRQR